jgi:hypothetical protein
MMKEVAQQNVRPTINETLTVGLDLQAAFNKWHWQNLTVAYQ